MLQKPHCQKIGSASLGQRGIGLLSPKVDVPGRSARTDPM